MNDKNLNKFTKPELINKIYKLKQEDETNKTKLDELSQGNIKLNNEIEALKNSLNKHKSAINSLKEVIFEITYEKYTEGNK